MIDDKGRQVKEAGPSVPVEVLGLSGVPSAGDTLTVVENEARAREVAAYRQGVLDRKRTTIGAGQPRHHVLRAEGEAGGRVPAGHQGRRAGLGRGDRQRAQQDLERGHQGPRAPRRRRRHHRERRHPRQGARARRSSASTSAPTPRRARSPSATASRMQYYDVIYDLTDAVKAAMAGELGPLMVENVVGRAEVREVFSAGKHGKAAGLLVTEGYHPQGAEGPHHARRRHHLQRRDRLAAALQGRRRRSPRRPRMRRDLREHDRHQGGRLHRDLRSRGARTDALTRGASKRRLRSQAQAQGREPRSRMSPTALTEVVAQFGCCLIEAVGGLSILAGLPVRSRLYLAWLEVDRWRRQHLQALSGPAGRRDARLGADPRGSRKPARSRSPSIPARPSSTRTARCRAASSPPCSTTRWARLWSARPTAPACPRRIDMNVTFIRAVKPGRVIGKGRVVSQGRTIAFLEGGAVRRSRQSAGARHIERADRER